MKKIFWFFVMLLLLVLALYAVLWAVSARSYPVRYGVTFSPRHAEWLGLDWRQTYKAVLTDLKPKYIRLSARWDEIETKEGEYNYGELDFLMNEAVKRGARVLLVVGEKQPRWPECFAPTWIAADAADKREQLLAYVKKTVERYRSHSALELWQVENEPFIQFDFGECAGYDASNVDEKVAMVHALDHDHQVVITDSGELGLWYRASRAGDLLGSTLYRVVRDHNSYVTYDWMPPALYRAKARLWGVPYERFFVSELQAEPWLPDSNPKNATVEEMEKSLSPDRLRANFDYTTHVGASRSYLWGAEWWYYMKTLRNDSRYWDIVKERLSEEKVVEKKLEIKN